ncbi:Nucleoside permease NupX [Piscirickettsia salmonis]|uniref:Na+ dependent nucleoside transporter family protein n=2 Tax=Piscirickettsia salmonis TaxID=1238 RepID=A0A1L6TDZ2_PISSA|nr:nucleoside transporter C-terminal domain-containing protein [Piscirickettsia salmonis]AKP72825.1 na+ dependent nucleoside transporter family protein [Piscirickettsia salmonis LF-89 = ATCC VR-1361]ALB23660.1 na+ dependent nucleoside transporter family protein [Piscirickettsia salmonis]ALY03522.1 na+ dependent nucleoside transporter family protein [Piscirickettsia salmonis]AMA43087.1 na+ dependent nucleoside transporter family protein [Piscirickettsia salmonis]AOS35557.1 na+ dependent nucleos
MQLGHDLFPIVHGIVGLAGFCFIAFLISENRRAIRWRQVFAGLIAQVVILLMLFLIPWFADIFMAINAVVQTLMRATLDATSVVFGYIGGGSLPFAVTPTGQSSLMILALQALPLVITIAALASLLTYWGVLNKVVQGMGWLLKRIFDVGGALGVGVSSNIFLGVSEAPLMIRPYLKQLTRSELFTLMTVGLAGTAGTVMGLYVAILSGVLGKMGMMHVISAVLVTIPAVITIARIIVPEVGEMTEGRLAHQHEASNSVEALTLGAFEGGKILLGIIVMMIGVVALVKFIDKGLALVHFGDLHLSMTGIMTWVMEPLVWLMGVPGNQMHIAANLMASKVVINELVAFEKLGVVRHSLDPRTELILVYAMCGFSNFSSIGILIGTYNALIPGRRAEYVKLSFKALIAAVLCTSMSGTVLGMFYGVLPSM